MLFKSTDSQKRQEKEWLHACRRLVRHDHYTAALHTLRTALAHRPSSALYDYQGVLLSLMGETQEALQSFSKALEGTEQAGERAAIFFHRGLLYGREQLYDQALLDLSRAAILSPQEPLYQEAKEHIH